MAELFGGLALEAKNSYRFKRHAQAADFLGMWTYCLPDLWACPIPCCEDPRDLTPAQIRARAERAGALLDHLRSGLAGLPGRPDLSDRERTAMGVRVFGTAPLLTNTLAEDLRQEPALYPDLRAREEVLCARNQEAAAWHDLRGTLGALYAIAHDNFLLAQSEATTSALSILDQLDTEVQAGTDPSPLARRRWHGAMTARLILRRHRGGFAPRTVKPAAEQVDAPSPQKLRARAQARRQRTVDMERIFRRHLAHKAQAAAALLSDPIPEDLPR